MGSKRSLTLLGWWVPCFLVLACVYCPDCGWWVWVRFWVGYKTFLCCCLWWGQASTLSGSRSTPCWRPLPVWWWLPAQPAWGCCFLGVGCVWWVVCDLYSGCEHICSVLFFVFCLVLLGIRWMPWHQELMKDVAACDMPRGAGERALLSEGVRMGEPNLGCAGLPSSERV